MSRKSYRISKVAALLLVLLMIGSLFGVTAIAGELTEPPEGKVPSVEVTEVEQAVPEFREADDGPSLRPNHPPIDQIPPLPMPQDTDELPASEGPGSGIFYNAVTGETIVFPVDEPALLGGFQQGGGYNGVDGGEGIEELPMTFADMIKITNTGDFPWRMNCKLVMRFGSDYYVSSGTMRDAETVLTAGHCVYDVGGYGWADEIWVYPGWDGAVESDNAENFGWGHGTYFGSWTSWTESGDFNYDVGIIGVTRAVGMLTGWYAWSYGGDCSWHTSHTYSNPSYPSECCNPPGCTLHNGEDMYYWFGYFDSCPSWNRLQIDTSGGCFNAGWGGMSGSGAYYLESDVRYVSAVASTSDRSTWTRYARQWEDWVNWNNNYFIPNVRGSAFDLQALDVNAEPATIVQGGSTTLLNHFATNPTDGSSASATRTVRVYLSTNDLISSADTLLSTQYYSWNFNPMSSVRVNMVQVTIPPNTPAGDYWIGVIYDSATDGNSGNNDASGWDAVPIHVLSCGTMGVSPLTWSPTVNAGATATQTVTVSATTNVVKGVTVSRLSGPTWLTFTPSSLGDIAAGTSKTFTMTAAPPTGTSGDFAYTVRVSNTCGTPSTRDVTGTIHVPDTTPPSVTVTSPNGGESWLVGSTHAITWTATDTVGVTSIDIYYSTNGGSTYPYTIATGEPNDGTYSWTIPDTPSPTCRVKVVAHDAAGNTGEDASNANFVISLSENTVYLKPQHSMAQYCKTTEVEIWVNATNLAAGQINLIYGSTCANVTNWIRNSVDFPMGSRTPDVGMEWITFTAPMGEPKTGEYKVGTLTIHCVNESETGCETPLEFFEGSILVDDFAFEIEGVTWINGTFACVASYTKVDIGVTSNITLANPGDIAAYLPPEYSGIDITDAIVLNVNVTDVNENSTDDAYTDLTVNVGSLDVETCEVFKEGYGFLPEVDDVTTLPTVKPPGEPKFSRDVANNSVIIRLYVGDPLIGIIPTTPSPTSVKVEPATQTIVSGQNFTVNISVENVTDMAADGAVLHFNPTAMQVSDITPGVISTFPIELMNNTAGTVTFAYALSSGSFNGTGPLATIEFATNTSAEGTFTLDLTDVELYNSSADLIPTDVFNGTVTVTPLSIAISSPVNRTYASMCVRLNVTIEAEGINISWIGYSLDGGSNVTIIGNTTVSDLSAGEHTMVVYARDNHSNQAASNTVHFTIHPADIDFNGQVYVSDLLKLAQAYNSRPGDLNWNPDADFNCDDWVYVADNLILAQNYNNMY